MEVGIEKVRNFSGQGYKIIATGEMGMVIQLPAVHWLLISFGDVEKMTGRGAGLTSKALEKR